ncbi:MAG TPA: type II toxin-antitoxin system CcdA family antitoxin [Mesorhizobium sp.]|jgi:antitoxin CcdA
MRSFIGDLAMLGKRQSPQRKPTNLSLDATLVAEAKDLNINISRIAEDGIARAVSEEKARLWRIENRDSIQSLNAYVEEHGIPFENDRQF